MMYDFVFPHSTKQFDLTENDVSHAKLHKTKMVEWSDPRGGDALSGVDWDKINRSFPYYSLRCRDCDFNGSNYESDGQPRA